MSSSIKGGKRGLSAAVLAVLASVFAVEGGYVDDPNDPGGATNHGVTEAVARNNGYRGDMRDLSRDAASDIYVRQYIERPGYLPYVETGGALGEELVDTGVNAGTSRSSRWFQESLNHLNNRGRDYPDITVDGQLGPQTLRAYQALQRKRGPRLACELLVKLTDAKQAAHYMRLGSANSKFETFMAGWVRTRIGNADIAHCADAVRL